ncbi:MAG TPA: hypothetical protein VFW48_07400 [Solirubrobacterales bacterium]|nr:hypothetical protein [Solirubrobacterales bacterium]
MTPAHRTDKPKAKATAKPEAVRLDRESVEAIAEQVAERLREERPSRWCGTKEAAALLGYSVDWVRQHREELGGERFGNGTRAQIRFDVRKLEAFAAASRSGREIEARSKRQPRRQRSRRADLLPIRGRTEP